LQLSIFFVLIKIIIFFLIFRQESRYGDSYWKENYFFMYLLRVLTSWAIVYNVHYLGFYFFVLLNKIKIF